MSNDERIQSFFPNQRKHVKVLPGGTGPAREGETRFIRMGLKMSLADGKLVGMPDYIAQAYTVLAKEGSLLDSPKILIELAGVRVDFYDTETSKHSALTIEGCSLGSFVMVREAAKREGEMQPIYLRFSLKTNGWIPKLWTWLGDNFQSEFWVGFEGSQMTMELVGAAHEDEEDEEQPSLLSPEETVENERIEAVSPEMDRVFGKPVPTSSRPKSAAAKRAEAALNGKAPALVS